MEAGVQTFPAFRAFENQLKTLCIKEFPCGLGPWREPDPHIPVPRTKFLPSISGKLQPKIPPSTQQKYPGPQAEQTGALQDYVTSNISPWHLDYTWSNEAEALRAIAVRSPWLIDKQFVLCHFQTLKIIDRGVTDLDEGLLKLCNLKELVLTANHIHTVNARYLPKSLQMLELCANKISDISALSTHPPLLVHLGLGFNNISFIGDYITGDIWPSLLSLDLSHNNLTDLLDVVQKFSTLPKLRYLVLTGNPFTFIPGYRGYIIDNLHCLTILDDIRISADEKHHFKGLARRREYILDEAKVMLEVKYLKGLPVPEEVKNPDDQPEFPVIERLYFVQFMFPAEHSNQANIFHILHDDLEDIRTVSEHHDSALETQSAIMGYSQTSEAHTPGGQPEIKRVNLSSALPQESGVSGEEEKIREGQEVTTGEHCLQLAPVNTDTKPWAEVIEMNWQTNLVRDDLIVLRDFFKQGMNISVIEQVVLCFPVEPECNACSPTSTKDKKTMSPPTKSDKKKKKETSPQELRREPPQLNTLASFHIPLMVFLDGEFEFSSVFTKQMDSTQSTPASDNSEDAKALRGSSKNTKKGKIKDDKKGKDKKPESKSKKNDSQLTSDEMSPAEPHLFEMQVAVRLHHWTTAVDSLKEKEEKNKAQEVENT